jgi:hypothetical protein
MTRFTDDELHALKARQPVDAVAGAWVRLRRRPGGKFIGPCPICSARDSSKTASRFECTADKWVCAVCQDGGDVIKLMRMREGLDFIAAVERLGGMRGETVTPSIAERRGLQDYAAGVSDDPLNVPPHYDADPALVRAWFKGWRKGRDRADYEQFARERERARLYDFWAGPKGRDGGRRPISQHWQGTLVETYLADRGIIVPDNARLRYHPSMPSFCDGSEDEPVLAHRGPAMLAAIRDPAGRFVGLHITWLDPAGPKGKAVICDPRDGSALPSKKVRGSKAGNYIDLGGADPATATRMIAGEGIETVLSVYTAMVRAGRDVSGIIFRSSADLGNLAGKALETLPHPELKTEKGRPQRVPGPDPDITSPAMPVPDQVTELTLLGDGDSDPFLTRNALQRSRIRHARPGRAVRVRFAIDGLDFNDMLQGEKKEND